MVFSDVSEAVDYAITTTAIAANTINQFALRADKIKPIEQ